ncbi:hypothetical protein OTU49_013963, partial [Cherax quadricarinatus]
KINLDLDSGTRSYDLAPPNPTQPLRPPGRRLGGVEPSLNNIRTRGNQPKTFIPSGFDTNTKNIEENNLLPNTKHWSSIRDPPNDNKYTEFEENKTNSFGNLRAVSRSMPGSLVSVQAGAGGNMRTQSFPNNA